jgi:hypothetical protein
MLREKKIDIDYRIYIILLLLIIVSAFGHRYLF